MNSILELKKNTSPGFNHIDYRMLKELENENKNCFIKLINNTIKDNNFPNHLGEVKIIPIQKQTTKVFDKANYRPIALLPNVTKTINSMIKSQLEESVEMYIPKYSFGFRKGFNTTHCLNSLVHQIVLNRENKLIQ